MNAPLTTRRWWLHFDEKGDAVCYLPDDPNHTAKYAVIEACPVSELDAALAKAAEAEEQVAQGIHYASVADARIEMLHRTNDFNKISAAAAVEKLQAAEARLALQDQQTTALFSRLAKYEKALKMIASVTGHRCAPFEMAVAALEERA